MVTKRRPTQQKKPKASPKTTVKIRTGKFSDIRGEANIAARDIIKNIKTIHQRALTPGEVIEKDLKIEVNELVRGIRAYLERLEQQVANPVTSVPYKGLEAYTLSDAGVFFGRDQAIKDLRKAMKRGRLTVLQAESGAGKTSLLQAGIVPRLIVEEHLAVLIRPQFENPTYAIKKCFIGDLKLTPQLAQMPLVEFLRRVKRIIGGSKALYLILDQFEEFFTKNTLEEDKQAFIHDLAECLNDVSLNVRWVISITADAFGQLGKFEPHIQNPYSNVESLYLLDRQAAEIVIAKPARLRKLHIQAGLVERLLKDLSQPQDELIAPTQVQLVCMAMYDDSIGHKQTLTLAQYEQRGCAEGILRDYIANVLNRYLPQEERTPAYKILEALVTSEKKRILRGKMELETALENRGIPLDIIESTLNHLVNRRLLRRLGDDIEDIQYELVHDYLLNELELNEDLRAIKEAEELLEQGKKNWKKFGLLLNKDMLVLISQQRKQLRLTHEDICLLLMSLAEVKGYEREWRYFLSLARKNEYGHKITNTLVPFLAHENRRLRNPSYKVLWHFVSDCPAPARRQIILENLASRIPVYLSQLILFSAFMLILYNLVWIVSRSQLEKIGWQTIVSLPPNCHSSDTTQRQDINADLSDPRNIIVFSKSPSSICESLDAGSSWVSRSGGLSPDLNVQSVAAYKDLLILLSPKQVFYWNTDKQIWEDLSIPTNAEMEYRSVSIGGNGPEIFIGSSTPKIISIATTKKCWSTIKQHKELDANSKGICWNQMDTSNLSGDLHFLSTNQKYIVANTSDGTWFSEIKAMKWEKQPGLSGPITSFVLHTHSLWDDLLQEGTFLVVLPDRGVQRGTLGNPDLSSNDEWPFPSVNGDNIWDWPLSTRAIAVSQYVFFADTSDSLERYPGWSIFDREWWQIMREQHLAR